MTSFSPAIYSIGSMPGSLKKSQEKVLKTLGAAFKAAREEKGMSLEQVGKKIDKDRQSIHKFENGEFAPTILYLLEVCRALEVDITVILKSISKGE